MWNLWKKKILVFIFKIIILKGKCPFLKLEIFLLFLYFIRSYE